MQGDQKHEMSQGIVPLITFSTECNYRMDQPVNVKVTGKELGVKARVNNTFSGFHCFQRVSSFVHGRNK